MKRIRFNFNFLIIFFLVVFKYLKMQYIIQDTIVNMILVAIIALLLITLIAKKKIKNFNKNWLIFGIIVAAIQIVFMRDIDILMMIVVALVFLDDDNAINNIVKYFTISLIVVTLITIILNRLGYLNYRTISRLVDGEIVQRNALGFRHPNEMYLYFFFIMIGIYYCIKNKLLYTIIMVVLSYIMYSITFSRTGFLCSIIFIILIWIYNNKLKLNKYMYCVGTAVTLILALCFGDINSEINSILSSRPYIYSYYIKNGALFNIIGSVAISDVTLDNMYLNIIVESGMILYIFYFIFYYSSGKLLQLDNKLSNIFIITLIYGCFETHTINVGVNCLLILQMYILLSNKNKFKESDNIDEKNKNTVYGTFSEFRGD